jgi:hypothetical protein
MADSGNNSRGKERGGFRVRGNNNWSRIVVCMANPPLTCLVTLFHIYLVVLCGLITLLALLSLQT